MVVTLICLAILLVRIFYIRYFRTIDVQKIHWVNNNNGTVDVIDVRDYNETYRNPIQGAINIPIAYLKRYYNEIPKRKIHLIVSNSIEKNVAIRFFRQKGYDVIGYTILDKDIIEEKIS